MKISKFQEYNYYDNISLEFINSFDSKITESDEHQSVMKKMLDDLKLNTKLVLTFGTGLGAFLPMVQKIMTNMKLEPDSRTVLLLTICTFTIIYIEEKKYKSSEEEETLVKDSKSMLEELRMHGVGNGIVKKMSQIFKSIIGIFNLISKHTGTIIETFVDMFAYSALLIPIMNGMSFLVGKYNLNMDTFIQNMSGLAIGLGTLIAKHGIQFILQKLKLKDSKKKEIINDVDTSVVHKFSNFDTEDGEMINEQ